jgi:sugar phosphate permease
MKNKYYINLTIFTLFLGYTGYYLCRSNLSIANASIVEDLATSGITDKNMANVAALGVLAYAIGKLLNGIIGDFIGGRKIFIFGMIGSVAATVAFGFSTSLWAFTLFWFLNRFIQSMGWGGLVKITSNWINYKQYGKIMGFLSLSYLVGDILARLILGQFQKAGIGWQNLFFIAAGMLLLIAVFNLIFLKEKPSQVGLPEPEQNPDNIFSDQANAEKPANLKELLLPYFKNFSFILILLMSFGLTAMRETLNFWSPRYLQQAFNLNKGDASQLSSLYLILGAFSILLCGWLSDKIGKKGLLIAFSTLPISLLFLSLTLLNNSPVISIALFSMVGFFLLGPYSFLAGAMSLDFGGKKGAATAAGLADSFGYVGGTLAVKFTGVLVEKYDWNYAFFMLAAIALLTTGTAFVYFFTQERKKILV